MTIFLTIVAYVVVGLIIAVSGAYFMRDENIDDTTDFMLFSTFLWPLWIGAFIIGIPVFGTIGGLTWVFHKIVWAFRNKKAGE